MNRIAPRESYSAVSQKKMKEKKNELEYAAGRAYIISDVICELSYVIVG